MSVVQFLTSSSGDWTCEQNGNMGAVKSVNAGRPGAEQTETEGTVEGNIQRVREESSKIFLNVIHSY